jgi:hypothetical protein
MQPSAWNAYLYRMGLFSKHRLRQERLRWGSVILICAFTVLLFTPEESKRSLVYKLTNPWSLLFAEQENPVLHLVSKIITPKFPEKMREAIPL